jgi:hypothetical protein
MSSTEPAHPERELSQTEAPHPEPAIAPEAVPSEHDEEEDEEDHEDEDEDEEEEDGNDAGDGYQYVPKQIPVARTRRILKLGKFAGISNEAAFLITKAAELFVG